MDSDLSSKSEMKKKKRKKRKREKGENTSKEQFENMCGGKHEVHAPSAGVLPAPLGEKGYVFHDVEAKAYWGLYNSTARRVAYRYGGG